jgi:hypothetical protein
VGVRSVRDSPTTRRNSLATSRFTRRSASRKSLLRPRGPRLDCACAKCSVPDLRLAPSRFSRSGFQYRSSASQTGLQYCAVDSMTASSTSCSSSHAASLRSWSGLLPNIHRSNWYSLSISTSDPTTASIFLWTSIPAGSVGHQLPPGRERRACCACFNQGRGLSPLAPGEDNDAQLFAQSRTLRIRQINGLEFSLEISTSALQAVAILPPSDFHEVSQACSKARSHSNG